MSLRFGWSDDLELLLNLPYGVRALRVTEEDEHHRNETLHGPGDMTLLGKYYFLARGGVRLAGSLGVGVPTGRRNRVTAYSYLDHHRAAELGVAVPDHSHLQLGSGTLDPVAGFEALWRIDESWLLFATLSATVPLYAYRDGYRTAPRGAVAAGPAFKIGATGAVIGLLARGTYAGRDRLSSSNIVTVNGTFSGTLDVPNTGRVELALQPTFTWSVSSSLALNADVTVPLYTRIHEDEERGDVQLSEPLGLVVGLSYSFVPNERQ